MTKESQPLGSSSYENDLYHKDTGSLKNSESASLPHNSEEIPPPVLPPSNTKKAFNKLVKDVKSVMFKQFLGWLHSSVAVAIYCFVFSLTQAILYSKYLDWRFADPYPIIVVWICFLYLLVLAYERSHQVIYKNQKIKITPKKEKMVDFLIVRVGKKLLWFLLFIITVLQVVLLTQGKFDNPFNLGKDFQVPHSQKATFFTIKLVAIIFSGLFLCVWWSADISNIYLAFVSANIIQILIAIALIQINIYLINAAESSSAIKKDNFFILTACFLIGQSMIGVIISVVINHKNRLHELVGLLLFLYDTVVALLGLLLLSCTIVSGAKERYPPNSVNEIPGSIPILFGCSLAMNILCFACTRYFRKRTLTTNLLVEEYNLMGLTDYQKQGWAKLINLNKKYNAGISGEHIVSLMENYSHSSLEGMTCKILRVYRDKPHETSTRPGAINKFIKKKIEEKAKLNTAFNELDHEAVLFQHDHKSKEEEEAEPLEAYKPISKNALKKLQKKNKQKKQAMDLKILEANTEKFYQELMSTEALVLLTATEEIDLCERIPGKLGTFLGKYFGKNGKYPLLVVKFGLLGFHWPFKRSTFYCSATKKPVARGAAVLYTLSEWNKKNEKCAVLMDPMYSDYHFEEGVTYSGWYKIKLPNSHIIDLRPFRNQKPTDYFKAIKYRTQDNTFKSANGEVWETDQFNYENCSSIINMNLNIANNRASSGQSSQLMYPDWEFISNLGNYSNENKYRTLLYLKVDGKIIASCVIFRLGETMTSDIQGLDHETSKKYKAYFVMMQEVIRMGLEEKVSFIDFGPTTEEAKVSIGCKVVPLTGCIYPRNPFMGPIIKFVASKVDV